MAAKHSYDPAAGFPRIMPSLAYEDVVLALGWLDDAFGFREHLRWADEEGIVRHAEMRIEDAFVELSQASSEHPTPKVLGHTSQSIIVTVDNVNSHYLRALASGALIIAEPEDKPWGLRQYTAGRPRRTSVGIFAVLTPRSSNRVGCSTARS